jgi:uncharacterized membrane protein
MIRSSARVKKAGIISHLWRWWHAPLVLAGMGPILAPLFALIGTPPFSWMATFIYWLGALLCPLPERSALLFGHPMGVCPLCYTALLSLLTLTLLYPRLPHLRTRWEALDWRLRLAGILTFSLPWLLSYVTNKVGLAQSPDILMGMLGIPGGIGAGLLGYFLSERMCTTPTL